MNFINNKAKKRSRRIERLAGLSFDKQTTRESFKLMKGYESPAGPHEKRFESLQVKTKTAHLVPFGINLSRQQLQEIERIDRNMHDYDINRNLVQERTLGNVELAR